MELLSVYVMGVLATTALMVWWIIHEDGYADDAALAVLAGLLWPVALPFMLLTILITLVIRQIQE